MPYVGNYSGSAPALPGRVFRSTLYYPPMLYSVDATASPTQSAEYCVRFDVGQPTTFDRIGLEVTTGVATAVVRLGIRYDNGSCYPSTLLLDAGTIDAASNGFKEITISQLLNPGRWWLTATMQVTTGVAWRARTADPFIGSLATASSNHCTFAQVSITGALPASFSSTPTTANIAGPKILLRAA